jgi:hypothetical protein
MALRIRPWDCPYGHRDCRGLPPRRLVCAVEPDKHGSVLTVFERRPDGEAHSCCEQQMVELEMLTDGS